LDTKGCRILEVAGPGYNRTVQGYNRLQDVLGYRSGKQQYSSRMQQVAGYTRIRDITV
jgi:hypothetical protein